MPIAGDIVANLTANTSGWTAAFKSALDPLNLFAGGVLAATGMAVSQFSEFGSQLQDMSERTGVTAEALSQYSFAAQQTDTSLESLQAGIVKMNKFLADAHTGGKESAETLAALGINLESLGHMAPDQQLELFADRLSQIDDIGTRGVMAMKVFGKGAIDLVPLLSTGADGIRSLREEADRLGLTMSNETAAAAEEMGDSIDKAKLAIKGAYMAMAAEFAPALTEAANWVARIVGENGLWIEVLAKTALVIVGVVAAMKTINLALQVYSQRAAIATALSGPKGWLTLAGGIAVAAGAVWALDSAFAGADDELNKAIPTVEEHVAATRTDAEAMTQAKTAAENQQKAMGELRKQYDALLPQSVQTGIAIRKMGEDWRAAAQAGAPLLLTFQELQQLQLATIAKDSGFAEEFSKLRDELRVLRGDITETELSFEKMMQFGVPQQAIAGLRQMTAERDALVAKQKADEKAAEEAARAKEQRQQKLTATRDEVLAGLKFPDRAVAEFAQTAKRVQDAVKAGLIGEDQGLSFLQQKQKELADTQSAAKDQRQALAEAVTISSDAANRQLANLLNRRPGTDPATKTNGLLNQTNTILTDVKKALEGNLPKVAAFGKAG